MLDTEADSFELTMDWVKHSRRRIDFLFEFESLNQGGGDAFLSYD